MSAPTYNQENYEAAGRAADQAEEILRQLQHEVAGMQRLVEELQRINGRVLRAVDKQAAADAALPLLHQVVVSRVPEFAAALAVVGTAAAELSASAVALVGDWTPEQ